MTTKLSEWIIKRIFGMYSLCLSPPVRHCPIQADIMSDLTHKDETVLRGSQHTEFRFGEFDHQKIPLEKKEWPVIIIISSMVGMTLSLLLGYYE